MSDEAAKIAAGEFGCRYRPAYSNRCGVLINGDDHLCRFHRGAPCCVCGEQATNECNHTGQFVCGARLCDDCEGYIDDTKASGSWGFMNHGHREKPVERRRKRVPREMTAADLGLALRAHMEADHESE